MLYTPKRPPRSGWAFWCTRWGFAVSVNGASARRRRKRLARTVGSPQIQPNTKNAPNKGRFGVPAGARTQNVGVGGQYFIQLDYGYV